MRYIFTFKINDIQQITKTCNKLKTQKIEENMQSELGTDDEN